jgi:hypothetical protein
MGLASPPSLVTLDLNPTADYIPQILSCYRGVSDQHLGHEAGSGGWEWRGAGDAAPRPGGLSRRRPGPPTPRAAGLVTVGAGSLSQARRTRPGPEAVVRRPDNPKGKKGCLKWKSTGGAAEQTSKHRARDAKGLANLRLFGLRQTSVSRGAEARGSVGPKASRAPSAFRGWRKMGMRLTPGRPKNRGDDACLRPMSAAKSVP